MLIKELRISDFLVFPGEQVITLPTEGESNLVVILAPNNTGKTNVIRALKFFFYGHLPDCTAATARRRRQRDCATAGSRTPRVLRGAGTVTTNGHDWPRNQAVSERGHSCPPVHRYGSATCAQTAFPAGRRRKPTQVAPPHRCLPPSPPGATPALSPLAATTPAQSPHSRHGRR